jgi:hypothetical protein
VTKDNNGGAGEQIACAVAKDGGALSAQATNNINGGTLEQGNCSPTLVTFANAALSFYITVTSPTSIDDQVDIRAVDFTYTATS